MRKFNAMLVALAGGLVSLPVWSADTYTIDPRHTFPSYEISHSGWSTQRGRFDKTSGKIVLDRAGKTGSVDVTIEVASLNTGVDKLNEHLTSEDFFNAAKFPTMTFKASKIVFNGDSPASIPGEFTLLGVTKPATLTVTRFSSAFRSKYSTVTVFARRTDWNSSGKLRQPSSPSCVPLRSRITGLMQTASASLFSGLPLGLMTVI